MVEQCRAALESNSALQEHQISSLPELWARKYIRSLKAQDQALLELNTRRSREATAHNLTDLLRSVSAQAWGRTETLLAHEVRRHNISSELIDPWQISKDVHAIYQEALAAYARQVSPQRFSVQVSGPLGQIRQFHTAQDPRVIGFVSMQFHYCGQMLCQQAPKSERPLLQQYFKVVDDLLYMPLQRAYDAAANYDYHHPRLQTVRTLLPLTSSIAQTVVEMVNWLNPNYISYTGRLDSRQVRISSTRDVEMFQIYLLTCILEQSISAIAQELFPLCVMLYPTLRVDWLLVQQMISLIDREVTYHLNERQTKYYQPHYQALWQMFSPDVFTDTL